LTKRITPLTSETYQPSHLLGNRAAHSTETPNNTKHKLHKSQTNLQTAQILQTPQTP